MIYAVPNTVKDHRNDSIVNALHHSAATSARSGNLPVYITNPTNTSLKAASEGREKRMKDRERYMKLLINSLYIQLIIHLIINPIPLITHSIISYIAYSCSYMADVCKLMCDKHPKLKELP